jgi:succinylarginine dihydrolase
MSEEVNYDGIVGPTHTYGGLSLGNIASIENRQSESNPKAAALQGLEKMKALADLGFKQAVLPPHERPFIPALKALGFGGTDAEILKTAAQKDPQILTACASSAGMWAANAATICPSPDSIDRHMHITPANLSSNFHRSLEPEFTAQVLKVLFPDPIYFKHHHPLFAGQFFADEGAANHTRFCNQYDGIGVQLFVYGRYAFKNNPLAPKIYPARQTFEASQAIARIHQIYPQRLIFAQQNPQAIDAGVFHNDVISVGNKNVFLYHTSAFVATEQVIEELERKVLEQCGIDLISIPVTDKQLSLADAVASYLFNSQLLSKRDGSMTLIAPMECRLIPKAQETIEEILSNPNNPIREVHYFDLKESMRNGGGPACLRLRLALTDSELNNVHQEVFLTNSLYKKLTVWIQKHYRDKLVFDDLFDPKLLEETYAALDELTKILHLGPIYSFQKG